MSASRERVQYKLDVDDAVAAIKAMNCSRATVAADWLLHVAFPNPRRGLDSESVVERVLLVDGLWRTRLFMDEGAADRIAGNLAMHSQGLLPLLEDLDPDSLQMNAGQVYEVARQALPVILKQAANGKVKYNQHYSFAAKFFHWCTRLHFPIMDAKARRTINAIQNQHGVRPVVRKDTAEMGRLSYVAEYERWIHFYSDLIYGLSDRDRERLLQADYDSLPPRYRFKNSLLRILDKTFWWRGRTRNA